MRARFALVALLLITAPVFAQSNGWQEIQNGWGEIQTVPGYSVMPAPPGCVSSSVPFFGASVTLGCDGGISYDAATDTLTTGRAKVTTLTSGQVAVAGTGGELVSSTGFTFAGTSAANWSMVVAGNTTLSRDFLAFAYAQAMVKWFSGSAYDTAMARVGINTIGFGANPATATDGTLKAGTYSAVGANAASAGLSQSNELLTLATGSTTTATAGSLLPANAQILFITGRVTTTITTAASYTVAPTGDAAWVLSGTATTSLTGLAAGSTFVLVPPSNAAYSTSTAKTITVTTNANPGAGAIRIVPFYVAVTPPSS